LSFVDLHAVTPLYPLVGDRLAGRAGLVLKQVAASEKKPREEADQYERRESEATKWNRDANTHGQTD
jgi:hypothetical protein